MVAGKRAVFKQDSFSKPKRRTDLESGKEYRDARKVSEAQDRREDLKRKLAEGLKQFNFEDHRKSEEELKAIKNKKIRAFYAAQNERLNDWAEVDSLVKHLSDDVLDSMNPDPDRDGDLDIQAPLTMTANELESFLPPDEREKRARDAKKARIAVNVNVLANVLLLIAKAIAVKYSGSLSLVASLADSALDLLCTVIVWSTSKIVNTRIAALRSRFPVGRRRLEPIGILVFSVIMVASFVQIFQESVTRLLPSGDHSLISLPVIAIVAMAGNAALKGVIGIGCYPIKTTQVQALVQDCKTDFYFNLMSLLFPLIGHKFHVWWLDPLGAALLSVYVVFDWSHTLLENVSNLTGASASDQMHQKLTFLAYRFAPVVDAYKSITAYKAGDGIWAEFDILLDEQTPLHRAHDVSETLQYCAEGLAEVDRAFVSADYTSVGPDGHSRAL